MAMTKRELIQFMDELVELASKKNKTKRTGLTASVKSTMTSWRRKSMRADRGLNRSVI